MSFSNDNKCHIHPEDPNPSKLLSTVPVLVTQCSIHLTYLNKNEIRFNEHSILGCIPLLWESIFFLLKPFLKKKIFFNSILSDYLNFKLSSSAGGDDLLWRNKILKNVQHLEVKTVLTKNIFKVFDPGSSGACL